MRYKKAIKNNIVLLRLIAILFTVIFMLSCDHEPRVNSRPNVLLILTDDQAYGDLSMMGNPVSETPHLDQLAREGVFFDHFYVSPVCAPTRASLLTGRYHHRTGVTGVTRGRENMNLNEVTLADMLKKAGYTTGIFGKWHNGAHYPYHPLGRGFDHFVGFTSGHWSSYFDTTIEKNGEPFFAEGYLPDVLTQEALNFIRENASSDTPFFCYLPYQTPHTPLQVPDKYFDKFKHKGADDFNATMYGMAENIDDQMGLLLEELDQLNIRENTIVIYLSDNGPQKIRYNKGLKGRKGQIDEGGMRVPFIVNWKHQIKAGLVQSVPLAHIDVMPTLLDLLKIDPPKTENMDGVTFTGLLKGSEEFPERDLFMEWGGNKRLLSKDYLMINEELYNLQSDEGQKQDLREQLPEVYTTLLEKYDDWIGQMPKEIPVKEIPIGHLNYPLTILPAHEANLYPPFEFRKDRRSTGIAYHSLYGWAHDWIDDWTKTSAYASWDIDIVAAGTYELELTYALALQDIGAELMVEIGSELLSLNEIKVFEHAEITSQDRIPRKQEAPETDWAIYKAGVLKLQKGPAKLTVKATKIPGKKSIELKDVRIRRID